MACAVVLALPTSEDRSSRRSARADTVRAVSTTKRSKTSSSRTISFVSVEVVDSAGLRYFVLSLACLLRPAYQSAEPWISRWSDLRVDGLSVLKSWSRSTGAVVLSAPTRPPLGILRALFGPGWSET